jgi:AbrB family looped-hinge helix DNA binding protein
MYRLGIDLNNEKVHSCDEGMAIFKSKLVKWGNSVGVIIPKPIRNTLDIEAGDSVELIDKDDTIVLRKTTNEKNKQS